MKYFVPELALGALLPPQSQFVEKFGGLPWGLPLSKWPLCAKCGNPQTHLATFVHNAARLDLGREGRAVLIFQCNHSPNETDCEIWDAGSGANAVVFLDTSELGSGLTEAPAPGAIKEIEMQVVWWTEQHDLVTPDLEASFMSGESYWADDEATEAVTASVADGAKLGSVPAWIQGGAKIDLAFQFAAQLGCSYHFSDPLPTADEIGVTISVRSGAYPLVNYQVTEPTNPDPTVRGKIYVSDITLMRYGSGFDVEAAEFGDGGSGYLFVNPGPDAPQGLFMWQCG